jgi:hypothetical protein
MAKMGGFSVSIKKSSKSKNPFSGLLGLDEPDEKEPEEGEDEGDTGDEGEGEDSGDPKVNACQAILDAIKSGSAEDLCEALDGFNQLAEG